MEVLPLKVVNTQEALAVAHAAYRINKGYVKDTRRYSEDKATTFSNKELVRFFFEKNADYLPNDYMPFKIEAEDFEAVAESQNG